MNPTIASAVVMNPAPCIAIEKIDIFGALKVCYGHQLRTRAQIRKGLLRVWNPGEANYFLWIPNTPRYESITAFMRSPYKRWWQPPI